MSAKRQAARLRDFSKRAHLLDRDTWLTGRKLEDNTVSLLGAPPGKTWIRPTEDSREYTAAWGKVQSINLSVEVDYNRVGELYVVGPDYNAGVQALGDAVVGSTLPPIPSGIATDVIPGRNLKPGRVRLADDTVENPSLRVWVEALDYDDGHADGAPLLCVPTATANKKAGVVIYYDVATEAFAQTLTNDYDLAYDIPITRVFEDVDLPAGSIPLAVVVIANGATALDGSEIFDLRGFLEMRGERRLSLMAADTVTLASAELTLPNPVQSSLIVAAESGTADDLETITGGLEGDILVLTADAGDTITVKHNTGNIELNAAADVVLTANKALALILDAGGDWHDLGAGSGGGSGGNVTVGEYADARPGSPSAGDLFVVTDGVWNEEVYDGADWRPMLHGALLTKPPLSGWSDDNMGSATVGDSLGALYLSDPAGASSLTMRLQYRNAPSTPYVITTLVEPNLLGVTNPYIAIGFRENSSGKLHALMIQPNVSALQLYSSKFNSSASYSTDYASTQFWSGSGRTWLRIEDDGTDRILSVSRDGKHFVVLHSVGRTDFLTADEVWFGLAPSSATYDSGMTLYSWEES